MNSNLEAVLEKIEELSTEELWTVVEHTNARLRQKTSSNNGTSSHSNGVTDVQPQTSIAEADSSFLLVGGAYRPTKEQIEEDLAQIFTPQELAEIDNFDLSTLPELPKPLSHYLLEDREDSRY